MKPIHRLSALLLTVAMLSSPVACTPSDSEAQTTSSAEVTEMPTTEETTAGATESLTEGITNGETEGVTEYKTEGVTNGETEEVTEYETEESTDEEESTVGFIPQTVQNPVAPTGADPWVIRHGDKYYYCYGSYVWFVGGVAVAEVDSLDKLGEAEGKQVFTGSEEVGYVFNYWAPELHYLNGEWYIYVAAQSQEDELQHMLVLKGTSQDPTDPFELVGRITDPTNKWGIDGTILQHGGEMYYIWSGWEGDENVAQNIYIAHMSDPCTIDSERVRLSSPQYAWEKQGEPYVNEGPAVLQHNGKTFVAYSASGSWTDDYCLGLLILTGDDPMNPDHWKKASRPVFEKLPGLIYGPGHNSFTTAADGSVWMVYHGNVESGTGWNGRSVWLAPITFDANGYPLFGKPQATVEFPVAAK